MGQPPPTASNVDTHHSAVESAAEMLARKDFVAARAAFEATLAEADDPAALEGLATACRALDEIAPAVRALERAYLLRVEGGEPAAAALVACTLADVELTDLGGSAVAAGWLARARHHLRTEPGHPARIVLEGLAAYRSFAYEKDPATARAFAGMALEHARRLGDTTAEIQATAYLGCIEVCLGELGPGFDHLDEASAAAVAGELAPLADLDVYCLLITACERVRDFDRADQWSRRVLALSSRPGSDAFAAFAHTQYASLLIWRGRWPEAEAELAGVGRDAANRPMTAAMAMVLRATLRRRQGRLDEARAELAAAEREPFRRAVRHLVMATRARLELDSGHPQDAADLARRYLRAVSTSDIAERIEAVETLIRARVALGDLAAADAGVAELVSMSAAIPTTAVRAATATARGHLRRAQGRLQEARTDLETAVELFDAAGLPPDATTSRVALAEVLLDLGLTADARGMAEAARTEAARLRATGDLAAATGVLRRAGAAPDPDTGALTPREAEILRLIAEGLTNAEIAAHLVLSPRTVERHVSNIYLKIGAAGSSARAAAIAYARRVGLLT